MKILVAAFLLGALNSQGVVTDESTNAPSAERAIWSPKIISGEVGPHSREWLSVSTITNAFGEAVPVTNTAYVELCIGLMRKDGTGRWVPSEERIDILPEGGAAATNGQSKAFFPSDPYSDVVTLITPDGKTLQSRPLCLAVFDGTNSLLLAELKSCTGVVIPPGNQVVYTDAFVGVKADLRYTYTRAGLEQDVILREQLPPLPAQINAQTARLQLFTEFFSPPQPAIVPGTLAAQDGLALADQTLAFGDMTVSVGRAFLADGNAASSGILVAKSWTKLPGPEPKDPARQFLIEEVPLAAVSKELEALPAGASARLEPVTQLVGKQLRLPPVRLAKGRPNNAIRIAQLPASPGFTIDYAISGNLSNFTFSNATYLVFGNVSVSGTVTWEGGACIKYTNGASITMSPGQYGPPTIRWLATPYRPIVFTSMNDDSVGAEIPGSDHHPQNDYCANPALNFTAVGPPNIAHFRISCAQQAISVASCNARFYDAQIVYCWNGVSLNGGSLYFGNALFAHNYINLNSIQNGGITVENATFSSSQSLISFANTYCGISFVNSIFQGITVFYDGAPGSISGHHNGFYDFNNWTSFGSGVVGATLNPFQSVGAGSYYLADGCPFRGAGTTSIDSTLVQELRQKTTYPPSTQPPGGSTPHIWGLRVPRDTVASCVDLGYHYNALDYLVSGWSLAQPHRALVLTGGVAVGLYGSSGFYMPDFSDFTSRGRADAMNRLVWYPGVQEQPIALAGVNTFQSGVFNVQDGGTSGDYMPRPNVTLAFTDIPMLGGPQSLFCRGSSPGAITKSIGNVNIQDCSLRGVDLSIGPYFLTYVNAETAVTLRNNVFERCSVNLYNGYFDNYYSIIQNPLSLTAHNNLFWRCGLGLDYWEEQATTAPTWTFKDNLLDSCIFGFDGDGDYASHIQIARDAFYETINPLGGDHVTLQNAPAYASGPLGPWYIASSTFQELQDQGSRTARDAGLHHYTTQLDQAKEGDGPDPKVDIGFHYVAVDNDGVPLDEDGDGLPDYFEDTNGDGQYLTGDFSNWQSPDTGATGVPDGMKDADGDGLSNYAELCVYGSDPTTAHTFSAVYPDDIYAVSGLANAPDSGFLQVTGPTVEGGLNRFTVSGTPGGAPAGTAYDLYCGNSTPPHAWRLYACGSPGQTEFRVPISATGVFRAASAFDIDNDGVRDGAEALFVPSGLNNPRSDGTLPDAWKVQWGLVPTDTSGGGGHEGNPDDDSDDAGDLTNEREIASDTDPWRKGDTESPRPVVTIVAEDETAAWGGQDCATFRISRSGLTTEPLTVQFTVGGTAAYGAGATDGYTLDPTPSSYPFSVIIEANKPFVDIMVTPVTTGGSGTKTVILGLIPATEWNAPGSWSYVVDPKHDRAKATIFPAPIGSALAVAIHDSETTRDLSGLSSTTWKYATIIESVKEALRSDGTPFVVVSDADIRNDKLRDGSSPRYPILISLATEAIEDAGTPPNYNVPDRLKQYVDAGGFVFVGSSSFTRKPNGETRGDFALAPEMGITSGNAWVDDTTFTKVIDHRLVSHFPAGTLTYRMPTGPDEISWGDCHNHNHDGSHRIWQVSARVDDGATTVANGNSHPYLLVHQYNGHGYFIYHAGFQPLIGHGGWAPGMYAYVILKNAIEWAFESSALPVARLSPWPYQYNAALMVRHDFEHEMSLIQNISISAGNEEACGAYGDYYFCTGIAPDNSAFANMLRAAVASGATIGPHNGGLENPRSKTFDSQNGCEVQEPEIYEHFHWGPDEALDVDPLSLLTAGYTSGRAYAFDSMAKSFRHIETWLTGAQNSPRLWVAPYFNATREPSLAIQERLGVGITGDQKLTPFPHWTLSTQTDGKRYSLLSEPPSDWFVAGGISQSLDPFGGSHTRSTVFDAVDFYYSLGALINVYSHAVTDPNDTGAGKLAYDYIIYGLNPTLHPRVWSANAKSVYDWWLKRSEAQISAGYSTAGSDRVVTVDITGARDPETAVEVFAPDNQSPRTLPVWPTEVKLDGQAVSADHYRTDGRTIKVKVGGSTRKAEIKYITAPKALDDHYYVNAGTLFTGRVLDNDLPITGLTAQKVSGEPGLVLNSNGSFTRTWQTPEIYTFTYKAKAGTAESTPATVTVVVSSFAVFFDDFTADSDPPASPWQVQAGAWKTAGGALRGQTSSGYAIAYGPDNVSPASWTSYSVEAQIKFPAGAYGGGIGGRIQANGARYAVWIYPEQDATLRLWKFTDWTTVDLDHPLGVAPLPGGVGTRWHHLKLKFQGDQIQVYYDGTQLFATPVTDNSYGSGIISVETWANVQALGAMLVDDLTVKNTP